MDRYRIADDIAHQLIDGYDFKIGSIVMWGDGILSDASGLITGKLSNHPLDRMTAACNALERAPDLFQKVKIRGMDSHARSRDVRGFRLIGKPRHQPTNKDI